MTPAARSPDGMVRAGGGVVIRPAAEAAGIDGGVEVLLVHRPRYDDWTFPKGKCDSGESEADAARREVLEETGFVCTLGRELSTVSYDDDRGRPKTVRYWYMTVTAGSFVPNDEVDEILWVPLSEASSLLSYGHDRGLLADISVQDS